MRIAVLKDFLKEWGALVGAFAGSMLTGLLMFLTALGFGVVTPRSSHAEIERRVESVEYAVHQIRDALVAGALSDAAQVRYLCYQNRRLAEVSGIACDRIAPVLADTLRAGGGL